MNLTSLEKFDQTVITFLRHYADEFGRFALAFIFFWFGILKVFGLSPAGPLVVTLLQVTFLEGISPHTFLIFFGGFEALLGILILLPKLERITFLVLGLHLITTVMPLFMLPDVTWTQPLVPTLIGQYILKNAALLAVGLFLFARLKPMTLTHSIVGEEID